MQILAGLGVGSPWQRARAADLILAALATDGERVVPQSTLAIALNLLSTFRDHIEIGEADMLHQTGEEIDGFLARLSGEEEEDR